MAFGIFQKSKKRESRGGLNDSFVITNQNQGVVSRAKYTHGHIFISLFIFGPADWRTLDKNEPRSRWCRRTISTSQSHAPTLPRPSISFELSLQRNLSSSLLPNGARWCTAPIPPALSHSHPPAVSLSSDYCLFIRKQKPRLEGCTIFGRKWGDTDSSCLPATQLHTGEASVDQMTITTVSWIIDVQTQQSSLPLLLPLFILRGRDKIKTCEPVNNKCNTFSSKVSVWLVKSSHAAAVLQVESMVTSCWMSL